jgi:hypothetical protein
MLVAVVMLFVVGAMAALSIDVVTLYTARSEAQLAADGAALAGARVLANSGMTSDTTGGLTASAQDLATKVATQVAQQNDVGGRNLFAAEVTVNYSGSTTNPLVTVRVQRTDLPTFFARIWGSMQITVGASATAEAYNPSGASPPKKSGVAPTCVKPWLLPNKDPTPGGTTIFDAGGAISNANLLGFTNTMVLACPGGDCSATPLPNPPAWSYYPGDPGSFPAPTHSLPTCSLVPTPTPYQESIAGCIETPISCNGPAVIDSSVYGTARNTETADAVNCLTHATMAGGDTVVSTAPPVAPFEFVAGTDNPISGLAGNDVMVSESLVTVPVFDSSGGATLPSPVVLVGFVQLFLNPAGTATPATGNVSTTVINMTGCGAGATGQPILGNGASPVAVRLISP